MVVACTLLSEEEFRDREDRRRAAVLVWPGYAELKGDWPPELSALSLSFLPPGSMWLCPWMYDDGMLAQRADWIASIKANPAGSYYLSIHFLEDWAGKRPPICVVCPGGSHWVVDAKSSNGSGWKVTGEPPKITCSPSILVPRYHGFLRDGMFTDPV